MQEHYLTIEQAANLFRVKARIVSQWVMQGKLYSRKKGQICFTNQVVAEQFGEMVIDYIRQVEQGNILPPSPYLDTQETAEMLRITVNTLVHKWGGKDILSTIVVDTHRLFEKRMLIERFGPSAAEYIRRLDAGEHPPSPFLLAKEVSVFFRSTEKNINDWARKGALASVVVSHKQLFEKRMLIERFGPSAAEYIRRLDAGEHPPSPFLLAKEVAQLFQVSERSVVQVWARNNVLPNVSIQGQRLFEKQMLISRFGEVAAQFIAQLEVKKQPKSPYLSIKEVAILAKKEEHIVRKAIKDGEIDAVKILSIYYIPKKQFFAKK